MTCVRLGKHLEPSDLIEGGSEMDESDEQSENADESMTESRERNPKVTSASFLQSPKQPEPMVSTEDGMQIDESDEH
jgi:hypothetical protein